MRKRKTMIITLMLIFIIPFIYGGLSGTDGQAKQLEMGEVILAANPSAAASSIKVKTIVVTEKVVNFQTIEQPDDTLLVGERVVVKAGVNGYDTVTYKVTYTKGKETSRIELSRVTTAPVDAIVRVGTKVVVVVTERTTVVENAVAYPTVEQADATLPLGERVVQQEGVDGYDTVTYDVTYTNGEETGRVEVSRVTTAPVESIVRVGTKVVVTEQETVVENAVAYPTVEQADATLPLGERVVQQEGVDGYDTVTYDVTYTNGEETGRVEVSRVTTAPVESIVRVGTKVVVTEQETVVENAVVYPTVEQEDATLLVGERVVAQEGVDGYDTVTYDVTYTNGEETGRVEVSRVTTAPVESIVRVGTKVVVIEQETVVEKAVAYQTVEQEDATLLVGERVVQQEGVDGYDTVTYDVTYTNGEETGRVEVSRVTTGSVDEIVRVGTKVVVIEQKTVTEKVVAYQTVEQEDATLPLGERVVAQEGVDGYDTVTYDVTYTNGQETGRVEVSRVTTAPVESIVRVGTKVVVVVTERTIVVEKAVAYPTLEQEDATLLVGERVVQQEGVDGYDTVTYDVTYTNGEETGRVEVSRVTTAPVESIVRVGTKVVVTEQETVVENAVAYPTAEQEDATLPLGERVVIQEGVDGYDTVTYDVTYTNGEETGRVEVSRVTTAPVDEIVRVGTKVVVVVTEQETVVENAVAYQTVEQEDATLPLGERVVDQEGVDGYDTVTYDVTYTDGQETGRVEVSRVTTAPVDAIVRVGTYSDATYVIYAITDTHLSLETGTASLKDATLSKSIVATEEQGVWMTQDGAFVTAATVSERTQRMQSFAAIANADQPDFVLHLGDGTAGPSDWDSFLAAWNSITQPKLFVPGNHDFDNTTYATVATKFGYNTRATVGNNKFSFAQEISVGNINFLLLDLDTNRVDSSGFQTKLDWAAGQLNSTTSPLALLVAHTAPHNYLRNNYDEPTAFAVNQLVQTALNSNPNLEKVQGIFGHEHPTGTYMDTTFGPAFPGLILKPNVYTVGSYTKITIDSQSNITWEQRDLY